jgi:hypothetical protein
VQSNTFLAHVAKLKSEVFNLKTVVLRQIIPMIQKWMLKAAVQKVIAYLPAKERVNYLFQKYVTHAVALTDLHFEWKIGHAHDHIAHYKKYGQKPLKESTAFELGTGWYPIVPISLYLCGIKTVHSFDIYDWMTRQSQQTTLLKFKEWHSNGRLKAFLPDVLPHRWDALMALKHSETTKEEFCQAIGLVPHLQDARHTGLPAGSIDLVCSNNTFEHIHTPVLRAILAEFARICNLKNGGVMSHFIDMSDHFAHFDATITDYNFLRYTAKQWQRIDNNIQPQNRLRFVDFERMYQELNIPYQAMGVRPGNVQALEKVPLSADYKDYTQAELAVTHGYLVSFSQ